MLKQVNEIVCIGVTLSQDTCAHANKRKRIKATRNAFYALQGVGNCTLHKKVKDIKYP